MKLIILLTTRFTWHWWHLQVHVFKGAYVSSSDGHRNLVNSIAAEPVKEF